jgi:hypothetical protein
MAMKSFLRGGVVTCVRRLIKPFGGALLSKQGYEQLLKQRARAVAELVQLEGSDFKQGITCVVFSKDRALQLHTLLRTYFDLVGNPASVFVVYSASNEAHARSYQEVDAFFCDYKVQFVREVTSFRETLLKILEDIKTKNIFFLVDDIVFIRRLNLDIAVKIDPQHHILSFRHSPHLRRSYTGNVDQIPPSFRASSINSELLEFTWFEQANEWSDPWSVDGQVLSTAEIKVLTRLSDFNAPNSYEGVLKTFSDITKGRMGLCYTESKILNLPINRVQREVPNRSGSVSTEFLLEQWNKGMMLDTSLFDTHVPLSPHEEHIVNFKKRS